MDLIINKTDNAIDCENYLNTIFKAEEAREARDYKNPVRAQAELIKPKLLDSFRKFQSEITRSNYCYQLSKDDLEGLEKRIQIICDKLNPINLNFGSEQGTVLVSNCIMYLKRLEIVYEYVILKRILITEKYLRDFVSSILNLEPPKAEKLTIKEMEERINEKREKFENIVKDNGFSSFEQFLGDLEELRNYRNLINHGKDSNDINNILSKNLPYVLDKMGELLKKYTKD